MTVNKPSSSEDEFFAREDAEAKRRLALKYATELAATERVKLQQLHAGCCPKCGLPLHELQLKDVVVDKCFHCHGIFISEKDLETLAGHDGYWDRLLHFFARRDYSDKVYE